MGSGLHKRNEIYTVHKKRVGHFYMHKKGVSCLTLFCERHYVCLLIANFTLIRFIAYDKSNMLQIDLNTHQKTKWFLKAFFNKFF